MEEGQHLSRFELGRARRAAATRRRRRRLAVAGLATLVVAALLFYFLGPWRPFRESESTVSESGQESDALSTGEASGGDSAPTTADGEEARPSPEAGGEPAAEATAQPADTGETSEAALCPPLDGAPIYPFTGPEAIACGKWASEPLDYPHFSAPRESDRLHAGIDIYPAAGEGSPVRAMKDGTVLKVEVFFVRYTGEQTYAVLVDHGDFVANYAELRPPALQPGDTVAKGDLIGQISGTEQLHFEMYNAGTTTWIPWYGDKPANLIDPTGTMLDLYGL